MGNLSKYEKRLFNKYLNDECTEEELRDLSFKYTEQQRADKINTLLKNIWNEEHLDNENFDQKKLLKGIKEKINKDKGSPFRRSPNYFYYTKIAATILIFLSLGFFLTEKITHKLDSQNIATITKRTHLGEKLTLLLPDKSKVILNSNTTISYPEKFADDRRQVKLNGEAYFEVTKNKSRPFQVEDGVVTVTVLGTSFSMDTRQNTVALEEGKVSVSAQGGVLQIIPGEMAKYNKTTDSFTKSKFNAEEYLGWKDGVIYIDNYDLAKITEILESWYGVAISVQNIDLDQKFTGKLSNRSLENILEGLCYSLDCKYKIDKDMIKIYR